MRALRHGSAEGGSAAVREAALGQATARLDAVQPGAAGLLGEALRDEPMLSHVIDGLRGPRLVSAMRAGMDRAGSSPSMRTGRRMEAWAAALDQQHWGQEGRLARHGGRRRPGARRNRRGLPPRPGGARPSLRHGGASWPGRGPVPEPDAGAARPGRARDRAEDPGQEPRGIRLAAAFAAGDAHPRVSGRTGRASARKACGSCSSRARIASSSTMSRRRAPSSYLPMKEGGLSGQLRLGQADLSLGGDRRAQQAPVSCGLGRSGHGSPFFMNKPRLPRRGLSPETGLNMDRNRFRSRYREGPEGQMRWFAGVARSAACRISALSISRARASTMSSMTSIRRSPLSIRATSD